MTHLNTIAAAQRPDRPFVARMQAKSLFTGSALAMGMILLQQAAMAVQLPVNLREATRFAVLAGSEITSVPTADIRGDVGLSPAARSKIDLTPVEVTLGSIYAADDGGAVAVMLTTAKGDLTTAYNDAAGRSLGAVAVNNADLGGLTLTPGLYKSSGTLAITGDLTLNAGGDANAVFIFQVATVLDTAPGAKVILSGNANANNIFWQVGSAATIGTTTSFKGTIMANQSISFSTGATLEGRALARIGAVTLESNSITNPYRRPTPPSFGPMLRAPNGNVTLVITNTPGQAIILQRSANLTNWTSLNMPIPNETPETFIDTTASGQSMRFYRASYVYP